MLKWLLGTGLAGEATMEDKQAPALLHRSLGKEVQYPSMVAGKDIADLKSSELSSSGEYFETWEAVPN